MQKSFELLAKGRFIMGQNANTNDEAAIANSCIKFCKLLSFRIGSDITKHIDSAYECAVDHEISFRENHNGQEDKAREIYSFSIEDESSILPAEMADKFKQVSFHIGSDGHLSIELEMIRIPGAKMIFENNQGTADLLTAYDTTLEQKDQFFRQVFVCQKSSEANDIINLIKKNSIDLTNKNIRTAWMDESGQVWPRNQGSGYAVSTSLELFTIDSDHAIKYEQKFNNFDSQIAASA
jgi:hypothetical protein